MIALLALLSCARAPDPASPFVPLDGPRLLRRASLDLRGVLPSAEELDAVAAEPGRFAELRDAWLDEPRHEERLVELFQERWHTEADQFNATFADYGLSSDEEYAFERAVGQEPLRLLARVGAGDLPWTEVVTADYTVANEQLGEIWPLDYPEGATGWQRATYTDGRPAAGVLATNGLWWRYASTPFNQNRTRAAAISRLLLCQDFLQRPVSFSAGAALLAADDVAEMVRSEPACLACHSAVEPLAAALFGFWWADEYAVLEMERYHPEREGMGAEELGVEPAWFGQPVDGLDHLGALIAEDVRFRSCAVQTVAELLLRRETDTTDLPMLAEHQEAFVAAELRLSAAIVSVTDSPEYAAGGLVEGTDPDLEERVPTRRLLGPAQLAATVEDLTGFTWTWLGTEPLDQDSTGYRVLAGGVDGTYLTRPQGDPGLTWALVARRLAQGAARHAVQQELVDGGPHRLFGEIDLDTAPGEPAFEAELRRLHWRLLAVEAGDEDVQALAALWSAVEAEAGSAEAWASVATVLLRDPEFLGY